MLLIIFNKTGLIYLRSLISVDNSNSCTAITNLLKRRIVCQSYILIWKSYLAKMYFVKKLPCQILENAIKTKPLIILSVGELWQAGDHHQGPVSGSGGPWRPYRTIAPQGFVRIEVSPRRPSNWSLRAQSAQSFGTW